MALSIVKGNAFSEGQNRGGWFLGHFIDPNNDPRSTSDLEIKWGVHQAGESRDEWAKNDQATTISVLISGRFRLQFPQQQIILSTEGDYVLWSAGVSHCWYAELDSKILTVRWPSRPGDSINMTTKR